MGAPETRPLSERERAVILYLLGRDDPLAAALRDQVNDVFVFEPTSPPCYASRHIWADVQDALEDTCALEDRVAERRVFQGITEASAYQAMLRACKNAKVPHYSPHSLRHRRITLWHQSGIPARELAERAGHARPSMSLDVYSHAMPADEVADERLLALIQ
jgi:hypothetical protein